MILEHQTSGYLVLLFLLLTAGIFFVLYILKISVPMIFPGKVSVDKLRKHIALAEAFLWGLILLTAGIFFFKYNIIFSSILLAILLLYLFWMGRYAFRDYIAGLVFKSENRFSLNDTIVAGGEKGEIKHFRYRSIEIETENGNRVYLPYSGLLGVISSPQKINETVLNFSFEIRIPAEQPFDNISAMLKKFIFSLPWTILKNEPRIQLIGQTDNWYNVKITLFTFDETYFQPMRDQLEEYITHNFLTLDE